MEIMKQLQLNKKQKKNNKSERETYKVFGFEVIDAGGPEGSFPPIDENSTCGHDTCCQFNDLNATELK